MTNVVAPTWRLVRVSFKKALSDGNYGSEAAEVLFEDYVNPEADGSVDVEVANDMLVTAREIVHQQLAHSPSANVRRALGKVTPMSPAYEASPEEIAARLEGDDDDDDLPL